MLATDRDEAGLQLPTASISADRGAGHVHTLSVDIGDEPAAATIMGAAETAFGALDVQVKIAGMRLHGLLSDATAASWDAIGRVNRLSHAYLTQAALPRLRASGQASIVNVSSTHAVNPRAGMRQHDATKAGIVCMRARSRSRRHSMAFGPMRSVRA